MFLIYRVPIRASVAHRVQRCATVSRRTTAPAMLLFLSLLVLAAFLMASGASSAALADSSDPAVAEGIYAFKAGAFGVALDDLKPKADSGDREAAYWLGEMYEEGLGVKRDLKKAVTYYRTAAKAGWSEAKLRLGEIYLQGTEELQDFTKARKWLERAAYDGIPQAQRDLAKLYGDGWGGDKDPEWAYVWYEFAARQGDVLAQRARDRLLTTMSTGQVAEAQKLMREVAPEVFGEDLDDAGKAPDKATKGPATNVSGAKPQAKSTGS